MPPAVAAAIAHPFITAAAVAVAGSSVAQYSQAQSATKAAKSAADTQQRQVGEQMELQKTQAAEQMTMAQKSQDALVAKEVAATQAVQQAQKTAAAQAKATTTLKKKAIARSQTIYTSPLGIVGMADVSRKILLGQ